MRFPPPFLLLGSLAGLLLAGTACLVPTSRDAASSPPPPANNTPLSESQVETSVTSISGIPLDPDARFGGVLVTAVSTDRGGFNIWEEEAGIAPAVAHKLLNMIVRPRTWGVEANLAENTFFELHPDIAKAWEQSEDGLQWTFHLRDGVRWSDGTPLTCADTKWTLDTIRPGSGLRRSPRAVHFRAVRDIQCTDPMTMVIALDRPRPALLDVIGMPQNVVQPQHAYEGNTGLMRDQPPTVTTGPFTLREWRSGESYSFERNPDYWDQPFPYLNGVTVQVLARSSHVAALRSGRIDIGDPQGYTGPLADDLIRDCPVCTI